jgi:CHAD domain-containing protein
MPDRSLQPADHVETEWQFDAPDLAAVERWLRAAPAADGVIVGPATVRRLRDVYLDTRDHKVFRAGFALRIRLARGSAEATLKAVTPREGGLVMRRELTQGLTAATPAALLAAGGTVGGRLRRFTRAGELRELAEVRTTRRSFPLTLRGEPAGEVTLDRAALWGTAGARRRLLRVEVELPADRLEALRPFVERLRTAGGLTPAVRSKYEWALGARAGAARPEALGPTAVGPAMGVGEVALAVLRKHYAAVLWHEPGTRLGEDPEHLHDMRVGTRRMRAALRLFHEALPPRHTERARRELQALGQALGQVRDLDVQIEQVEAWWAALITVPPAALDPFLDRLRERRETARAELIAFLDAPRYRRLMVFLRAWLGRRTTGRRPGVAEPVRSAGPRLLSRARRRVMRQGAALAADSPAAAYHRLRILGKRLRYALEFLEPVYGPPARPLIRALVEVQDILGLHQDAQVAMAALPALARDAGAGFPEATRAAVGEIAQLYAGQAERLRGGFSAAFSKLRGKDWKELKSAMDTAVAELAAEVLEEHVSRARGGPPRGAGRGAIHGDPDHPPRHRRRARRAPVAR